MDKQKMTNKEFLSDAKREKVKVILIQFFDDFPDHPFKVKIDEDMEALIASVKAFGILTPLLARKTEWVQKPS